MAELKVRPAVAGDAEIIEYIARRTWADTYEDLIPAESQAELLDQAYAPAALRAAIEAPIRWFLVASLDDEVVGYADFGPVDDTTIELFRIYVRPGAQRSGLGTALLESGLDAVRKSGLPFRRLVLHVEEGNEKGLGFYRKHGFEMRPAPPLEIGGTSCCALLCEKPIDGG